MGRPSRITLRITLDGDVYPDLVACLAPLARNQRRQAALQLLRDGLFFRRWYQGSSAAPSNANTAQPVTAPQSSSTWQPLCAGDPGTELGIGIDVSA
jgi:endonuclease YncB( thermonuclease family)